MKTTNQIILFAMIAVSFLTISCEKYLEEPSNKNLSTISSLDDIQAILNNFSWLNYAGASAQEVSADDYYINDADFASLAFEPNQRLYTWQKSTVFLDGSNGNDWMNLYRVVHTSNTALEKLSEMGSAGVNKAVVDNLKGQALVFRAISFLDAVQIWSPAYDKATASTDKGIPLRLNSDFNEKSVRASVEESYARIISDLEEAVQLLPASQISVNRPSKAAAYGLLARTYLWMRDYQNAGLYADSCLKIKSTLINYNTLKATDTYSVKQHNVEIIFEKASALGEVLAIGRAKITPSLYNSYASNDLRKSIFFSNNANGTVGFRGFYSGSQGIYSGITTNEMYLISAESRARGNKVTEAMTDLNTLLVARWKANTFIPLTAANESQALALILQERRKELLLRGFRWMDIKRLNKEGANISLSRAINGTTYTLLANDPGFALPLPDDIQSFIGK